MAQPRLASLFAGIGGFDLSAERSGFDVAWEAENDPFASRILARRFPQVPNLGDVTGITDAPPVDVITFGSPCQDLSVAGRQAGFKGERSGLFFEAVRIIRCVRPAIAVWENVPGALSSSSGRDFAAALDALAECGALDIAWRVLDARYFGVAQRRRRVFVVADFVGHRAAEILFESSGGAGDPPPIREARASLADAVAFGADRPCRHAPGSNGTEPVAGPPAVAYALSARNTRLDASEETLVYQCHGNNVGPLGSLRAGNGAVTGGVPFVANTLRASDGHHGYSSPRGDGNDNLIVADLVQITSKTNRSRAESGSPSPTLATSSQMIVFDAQGPGQVRRLMPHECELLQGFAPGWTCPEDHPQPCNCQDGPRYRAIGNAVAVPVAEWVLQRIRRVIE